MADSKYGAYILAHPIVELPHPERVGVFNPTISFDGEKNFHSDFSLILAPVTEPMLMEDHAHAHDFDMYLTLIGFDPNGLNELGAEIEMCLGEEEEKHIITRPTSIFIPKGLVHCPMNFRRVDKPVLLIHASLAEKYTKKE